MVALHYRQILVASFISIKTKVRKETLSTCWTDSIVLIGLNISALDINTRDICVKHSKQKVLSALRIDRLKNKHLNEFVIILCSCSSAKASPTKVSLSFSNNTNIYLGGIRKLNNLMDINRNISSPFYMKQNITWKLEEEICKKKKNWNNLRGTRQVPEILKLLLPSADNLHNFYDPICGESIWYFKLINTIQKTTR